MSGGGYIIPAMNFDFPNSFPSGVEARGVPPLTKDDGDVESPFGICGVRTSTDIFLFNERCEESKTALDLLPDLLALPRWISGTVWLLAHPSPVYDLVLISHLNGLCMPCVGS